MSPLGQVREKIKHLASKRILILDGSMGVFIQQYRTSSGKPLSEDDFRGIAGGGKQGERFKDHPAALKGCNDLLCLTMPDIISGIHEAYLKAGADIIETNSFNANAVSLADYGLADLSYEISAAAAALARNAADSFSTPDKPRFVAGSISCTAKGLSIPIDMGDPGKRAISWDELEAAYYDNARGLVDGGSDLILIETIFDTLNAKAAIFAVRRLEEERGIDIPVILSATVLNSGGRLLSGQTLEAFCVSVLHADPLALGLNCSFGAGQLTSHIAAISAAAPCLVSAYPNAGFPDQTGVYDESPEAMADHVEEYLRERLVNIVGGCCGSMPAHIAAIAERAEKYHPRPLPVLPKKTQLAGLEVLEVSRERGLTTIGERCNVAGSPGFLKLIKEGNYEGAAGIAREMAESGAAIIDVCMDDPLLDVKAAMTGFLNFALHYPDLARLPMMIDSSDWGVIEAGLQCLQGKGLVNSISLKDGEAEFLRRARLARAYGAAVVVMLIDEQGQALSYERRIEVAARSWKLLTDALFPPEDIVFDPIVLAAGTGINETETHTPDFMRSCAWIRDNCPGAQISGGISNLSCGFRGNETIREAMHAVFIKHALEQGLSMAIVNPAALVSYDEIDKELRLAVEDLILNAPPAEGAEVTEEAAGKQDPLERLLSFAETGDGDSIPGQWKNYPVWRGLPVEERILYAMIRGIEDYIAEDIEELKGLYRRPLEILDGPLLRCLREVGDRFGAGRMFLPQLIRAARLMKKAVAIIEPYMESAADQTPAKARILIATVKGDVHDIGKNIVALVLGFSGHEVIDMGVMAPAEKILEKAKSEKVDFIGLSGLISLSLGEMIHVAREMERQKFSIPLLIGGAAASLAHTVLRIAPEYSGPVVYIHDAGHVPAAIRALLSPTERPLFLEELKKSYTGTLIRHDAIRRKENILPLEEARKNKVRLSWSDHLSSSRSGKNFLHLSEILECPQEPECPPHIITLNGYSLERIIPHLDWTSFVQTWDLAANTYPAAYSGESREEKEKSLQKLLEDAKALLSKITDEKILSLRGVLGFFPAYSEGDDVVLPDDEERFIFPRNQERKPNDAPNPCLADFILPRELYNRGAAATTPNPAACLGLFALSAGFGLREAEDEYRRSGDDYSALLLAGLANSLAEAFSENVYRRLSRAWGGGGTRPVFGYPACPDHLDKETAFKILGARQRCGLELTESGMIIPAASVCGMYMAQPGSYYFNAGIMGEDQLNDWAGRKGITPDEARTRLGWLL